MRTLLFALVALIVAVVAGTVGLLVYQARERTDPAKGHPPVRTAKTSKPPADDTSDPPFQPDDKTADAEKLPDPPKVSDKSELKALNQEKTLYLEIPETGEKRVLFAAEVCLREGILEVFVCKKQTKEHEAILRTDIDARFLHAALLAAGAKNGKPVQWVNPKTEEPEYKPASGQTIRVSVHYTKGGRAFTHPAQEWILDKTTKQPMAHDWVFAGSRFVKNPDRPQDPEYYLANNGEVISISNFMDSMLDLPVQVSKEERELIFEAVAKKIPPLGSKVWVVMEPVPDKKK
ncbi:MAG: YdjY domain-containing protein [Gemmataceae bacterium]